MKNLGIVVEYNPFHSGHAGHLTRSKEISGADSVVAVMSGNFVQRGEPAIADKWERTRIALEAGVDLVIELPLCFAAASAEVFARGAVALLEKSGVVNCMCFGSEWGSIAALREGLFVEDDDFRARLREALGEGLSYPAARARAADVDVPNTPNNILGIEYLKALDALGSQIEPLTVPRSPGSAKEVRAELKKAGGSYADLDNLSMVLHYILRSHSAADLREIADVSEGLENRLRSCAEGHRLISEIIGAAKTKRYTYLRLQRAVLHIILGIKEMGGEPQYIRVLGFRRGRADLLGLLEKRAELPVVTNLKNASFAMLDYEIRATRLYGLAFPEHRYFNEYTMPIVVV